MKPGSRERVGIYGGTFNPVHYGHLINIELMREHFSLDRIIFIPAKSPVHKQMTDYASPEDRFNMTQLAVSGNSALEVSDIEITRDTPSYTIYTLDYAEKKWPSSDLFLVIGSDSFNELDTWKSFREILRRIPLIVMKRPGSDSLREDIMAYGGTIYTWENPMIDISSSLIRERIRLGLSVRYMTPDSVIGYINNKGLYHNWIKEKK